MAHKNNHVAEEDFYKFMVEVVAYVTKVEDSHFKKAIKFDKKFQQKVMDQY